MNAFRQFVPFTGLWLGVLMMLGACASMPAPETMNQRMALIQISYITLLDKAVLYRREGRISPSQEARLTEAFDDIERAIAIATEAIRLGKTGDFNNQSTLILSSLTLIRNVLAESDGGAK